MIMNKHTPGPWKVVRADIGDDDALIVPVAIESDTGFKVVDPEGGLATFDNNWRKDTIEANAVLIAAAPELLKALEKCADVMSRPNNNCDGINPCADECSQAWYEEMDALVKEARVAIAKARGEVKP